MIVYAPQAGRQDRWLDSTAESLPFQDGAHYEIQKQEGVVGTEGLVEHVRVWCDYYIYPRIVYGHELHIGRGMIAFQNGKGSMKIAVPKKARKMIMKYFHDSVVGDHMGITKTRVQIERGQHSVELPVRPWDKVFVDMYGHLPRSLKGNNSILILFNAFSKLMVMLPLQDMKVTDITKSLIACIWKFFGGPEQLVSDNTS
ncbi:hypothetical protein PR048_012691 [Dryococelus australis]|uniref:Integrase catalytic domain-containing protein n=1 Tax=Dryococelus australis TaxID=614101 RepID=A0ABQ9HQQ2_9NEOP|nr:hypothetical protein PR048_012691 [Dryococelus australis]